MILRWPGHVPAAKVYRKMVSSMDLYSTLVRAVGLPMPEDQQVDGVDLVPFISINGANEATSHAWLCWQNRSWLPRKKGGFVVPTEKVHNSAIRKGNWKLVRLNEKIDSDGPAPVWQLYDLRTDVGEQQDVAEEHAEIVKDLNDHSRHGDRRCIQPLSDLSVAHQAPGHRD